MEVPLGTGSCPVVAVAAVDQWHMLQSNGFSDEFACIRPFATIPVLVDLSRK